MFVLLVMVGVMMALSYVWMAFRDPESLWDIQRLGYRLEGVEARPGPGWEIRQKIGAVVLMVCVILGAARVISLERATAQQLERINQEFRLSFPQPTPTVYSKGDPRYGR